MLEVPVPCESGATAVLILPPDGLEADDALRLAAFIAAWALDGSA